MADGGARGRLRTALVVGLLAAVAAVLGLRAFVGDLYTVRSSSMVPTVLPDERVLVRYAVPAPPARFGLVVFRDADGSAVVKRVAGLPGERVRIDGGDLLVDGRRLGADTPRIALFDGRRHDPLEVLDVGLAPDGPWTAGPATTDSDAPRALELDARTVPAGSDAGMAFWRGTIRDGWIEADGTRVPGVRQVNDVAFELEVRLDPAGLGAGHLRLRLVEGLDTFELRLGEGAARLVRRPGTSGPQDLLAETAWEPPLDRSLRLAIANVDDELVVRQDGAELLRTRYATNRPYPGVLPEGRHTVAPQLAFGADGCRATFRLASVERDLFLVSSGEFAVDETLQLGLDEVFLLGDNSARSADSRVYGPVRLEQLVGVPVAVLRPLERARRL